MYQEKSDFQTLFKNMYINFMHIKFMALIPMLEFHVGACIYFLKFFFSKQHSEIKD